MGTIGNASHVFRRDISRSYPLAVAGEGAIVRDSEGRDYIDGAAGVFVAILGHSPTEVAEKIAAQAARLNFAYTGDFATEAEERLAEALIAVSPKGMSRVWLTSSGSTANEAAIKLARQYHLLRGNPGKTRIISRWHSYHGSTMGALSMTGTPPRRRPYEPYLLDFPHVSPPYCYRCPFGHRPDSCAMACADEFEAVIRRLGAEYISAVILEPIAGGPLGALVSPPDYLRRVREICDRHDIIMIVDEIVSGMGRSGTWLAIEESGVVPDIVTLAKGLGGGFVPIGAMLVHDRLYNTFDEQSISFTHGESFTGHILLGTAGLAVIDYIKENDLLPRVNQLGERLAGQLEQLAAHPLVGEVRGRGLLYGVELVREKSSKAPFDRSLRVSESVIEAARKRDVLLLAGNAAADGVNGDTVVIAPPYVISDEQLDRLVMVLAEALDETQASLSNAAP